PQAGAGANPPERPGRLVPVDRSGGCPSVTSLRYSASADHSTVTAPSAFASAAAASGSSTNARSSPRTGQITKVTSGSSLSLTAVAPLWRTLWRSDSAARTWRCRSSGARSVSISSVTYTRGFSGIRGLLRLVGFAWAFVGARFEPGRPLCGESEGPGRYRAGGHHDRGDGAGIAEVPPSAGQSTLGVAAAERAVAGCHDLGAQIIGHHWPPQGRDRTGHERSGRRHLVGSTKLRSRRRSEHGERSSRGANRM